MFSFTPVRQPNFGEGLPDTWPYMAICQAQSARFGLGIIKRIPWRDFIYYVSWGRNAVATLPDRIQLQVARELCLS